MIITDALLPKHNYRREVFPKKQIVLHHTAGNPDGQSSINWWAQRLGGKGTVGTAYVISRDGTILRAFEDKYWASHLGMDFGVATLDRTSIGIELANWGPLLLHNGKFVSAANTRIRIIPEEDVITYAQPWRGSRYYHRYSDAQLQSLSQLLQAVGTKYKIPTKMRETSLSDWAAGRRGHEAIEGERGIFTHALYRKDKSDCHPQAELMDMLM